ncbi:MAG TPA: DMT family transporter [Kofleriaceae bacterium]|jgi:drug/metabolite transporter (DMT)-like permease
MSSPSEHRRALALLVLTGLFWSSAGVLIEGVAWSPAAIWSVRSAIAAASLLAVRRFSWRGITRWEWAAACGLAATTGLFVVANKLTTPANAILIQYSAPVWVALFGAWFLGERVTKLDWATIVVVLGGIALFFRDHLTVDHAAGNVVALAAGVAFAFGAMTMRKAATTPGRDGPIDPLRPLLLGNLLGAVLGAPWVIASSAWPDAKGWGALVALGVVQQGAAYLCYGAAIRHASAIDVMLVPVIEPILSPIWVAIAYGEIPGPWALVGGVIVVGAVTLRAVFGRRFAPPSGP